MKVLIVGRTSTGKDSLKDILIKTYGWKFVISTTNRPKRSETEDTHVFLTTEEVKAIPPEDKVAVTVINGYEYFATREQVEEADGYIIDPNGVYMLLRNMPEEWFLIVYMRPANPEIQEDMAIRRAANQDKEKETFHSRQADEDEQFTLFEQKMESHAQLADNCDTIISFTNNYEYKSLENLAIELELKRRFHANIRPMLKDLIDMNIMQHDDDGNPMLTLANGIPVKMPLDGLIEFLAENDEMLGNMTRHWLQLAKKEDLPDE